ncbi:hypothetical protein [Ruegeria lacuscaerulensis]|uniref:hypothetical protein n=1 Tax=Ruegeria lacuscaerulensis TaxID=55218 RepID=UPI00147C9E83|nr:hypothetical protein [Ruegeria lacuscaerulensis]
MKKRIFQFLKTPEYRGKDSGESAEEMNFLIYQMGKVGSKTIYHTLLDSKFVSYHTHSHAEARRIISNAECKLVVITGFREPLARTISAFFHNIDNQQSHWFLGDKADVLNLSTSELIDAFNQKMIPHLESVVNPWFENFLESVGVDRTQLRDNDWGFTAASKKLEIFGYKLERFDDFGAAFFNYFPEMEIQDGFKKRNIGSEKWYASIYRNFVASYKIDEESYDRIFKDTSYSNNVYSRSEIKRYASKFLL